MFNVDIPKSSVPNEWFCICSFTQTVTIESHESFFLQIPYGSFVLTYDKDEDVYMFANRSGNGFTVRLRIKEDLADALMAETGAKCISWEDL